MSYYPLPSLLLFSLSSSSEISSLSVCSTEGVATKVNVGDVILLLELGNANVSLLSFEVVFSLVASSSSHSLVEVAELWVAEMSLLFPGSLTERTLSEKKRQKRF